MSLPPKSRRIPPLETIYEESGSYASSILPRQQVLNSPYHSQAINGLISARSIATVDIHRQRVHPSTKKPPIEVRFRDGSKRFIQSSSLVLNNGRSLFHSSPLPQQHQLSSEKPIVQSNGHPSPAHPLKTPLVFTIITADDLERAGATPSICSSPDEFDRSYLTQSFSVSSVETMRSLKDTSHGKSTEKCRSHLRLLFVQFRVEVDRLFTCSVLPIHIDRQ